MKTSDLQYSSDDDSVASTLARLEARKKSRHSGKQQQQKLAISSERETTAQEEVC